VNAEQTTPTTNNKRKPDLPAGRGRWSTRALWAFQTRQLVSAGAQRTVGESVKSSENTTIANGVKTKTRGPQKLNFVDP
jgi:hypothetical protein